MIQYYIFFNLLQGANSAPVITRLFLDRFSKCDPITQELTKLHNSLIRGCNIMFPKRMGGRLLPGRLIELDDLNRVVLWGVFSYSYSASRYIDAVRKFTP